MRCFLQTRLVFTALLVTISVTAQPVPSGRKWTLHSGALEMKIEANGGRFAFSLAGTPVIPADPSAGIVLNGKAVDI